MGVFEELYIEITNMDLDNFIVISLIFGVSFYFSKKAQSQFLHILYSGMGIYLLLTMSGGRVIYDLNLLVGLGLVIPQISFLRWFVPHCINTVKMMTSNTYFFFISIYYKILRFINWIQSIINMMRIFFTTFSLKKENYSEQDSSEEYENRDNKESKENLWENSENNFKEQDNKYSQFYSSCNYIVLGVSKDDNFPKIKTAYRKLIRVYHTDVNPNLSPNDFKLYTEIMQKLNNAYENLEKKHK